MQQNLIIPNIQNDKNIGSFQGDLKKQYESGNNSNNPFDYSDNSENHSSIDSYSFNKETVTHPWRRYFARTIDHNIYLILWIAFAQLILRWNTNSRIFNLVNSFIALILMLFIEPVLLSTIGNTFGKWIFGLKIRNIDDTKLSYKQAFKRTFGVISNGYGYGIPIYSLIRLYKCYQACKEKEPMVWEEYQTYKIKIHKLSSFAFVIINIAIIALFVLIDFQAKMPIHRGNITATEYSENCNYFLSYNKVDLGKYMNEQGLWVDKQADDDSVYIPISTLPLPNHELIITDGIVTGVKLEVETTKNEWVEGYILQKYLAIHSFLVAQSDMNCIDWNLNDYFNLQNNEYENYSITKFGVKVTNKVEYSGYEESTSQLLIPKEGERQHFHMIFTLEKIK